MNLNMLNFFSYSEDEEIPNGDYWKFARMTENEIIEAWNDKEVMDLGRFINLSEIIFKIKNPNLKSKMKEQLKIIINISKDMDYISGRYPVYTEEELKQIVESLMKSILESNPTAYEIMKIDNYNIKDKKWLIEIYDKIFRSIDDEKETA